MSRTLDILETLIAFPTISPESNLSLMEWVKNLLIRAGFTLEMIPSACGAKTGLHASLGPRTKGGICLSGHSDVVPVEGQNWTRPQFQMTCDASRVYGRGSTDMKGFLASTLAMAERAGGQDLHAPLSIVVSYDEEIGCVGIREMLPQLRPLLGQPELVIVGEPTGMQVATGHKGKSALSVTCSGEPGHSALAPEFTNAIHVAAAFIEEIRALQTTLAKGAQDTEYDVPYSTLHVGRIAGGQALNMVPDLTTLEMEFRHLAETTPEVLLQEISAAAERAKVPFNGRGNINISVKNTYPGLAMPDSGRALDLGLYLSGQADWLKVPFGTEAGYFQALGLDTLVIGPGDMARDGHKPDEGIDRAALDQCDQMMDRVLNHLTA